VVGECLYVHTTHVAFEIGKLEKEMELRQAAEERATAAEHSSSLMQLDLKKAKAELQKVHEDLQTHQHKVSSTPYTCFTHTGVMSPTAGDGDTTPSRDRECN